MHTSNTTNFLEKIFAVTALVIFTGAFFYSFRERSSVTLHANEGDTFMQMIFAIIYCLTFLLIAPRLKEIYASVQNVKWLWIVVFLAILSTLWSSSTEITLRRGLALFATTLFGIYLGTVFDLQQQLRLFAIVWAFLLLSSLLTSLLLPNYGIMDGLHYGRWQGVFVHKNLLGRMAGLGFIFFAFYSAHNQLPRWLNIGLMVISLLLLYKADSITSVMVLGIITMLIVTYQFIKTDQKLTMGLLPIVLSIGVAILVFGLSIIESVFALFQRDLSLTGRTNLWPFVTEMIQRKLWFGYGYSGFWLGENGPSYEIWRWSWDTPHAHNGFLDIALDIGLVGLALVLFGFIRSYRHAFIFFKNSGNFESSWPLIYMTYIFLNNLTESVILNTNDAYWILYVATIVTIANIIAQNTANSITNEMTIDELFVEADIYSLADRVSIPV